ncbi:hypothetical protein M0657_011593 [Pyricularia oryzae]|nr:hypothetical protein M0657_011593 [Pyricularia oryzae]
MLVVGREIQLHVATVKGLDYSCSVATEIPSKLLSGVIRRKDDNKRTGKFKLNFGLQRIAPGNTWRARTKEESRHAFHCSSGVGGGGHFAEFLYSVRR